MNLYLIGDSWSYGAGSWLGDVKRIEKRALRLKHRFATILKDLLDINEIIDYSYPGRSNAAMVRDSQKAASLYRPGDLICVGLTSPYRLSIYVEEIDEYMCVSYADDIIQDDLYYNTPTLKQMRNADRLVNEMKKMVVNYTDDMIISDYEQQIKDVRKHLSGTKHVLFSAFTPIGKYTHESNVCFYPYSALQMMPDNVSKRAGKNSNESDLISAFVDSSGHPNVRGHQFIATELYKYIMDQGILND